MTSNESMEMDWMLRPPLDVQKDFARRARTLRIEQNLSQVSLAERIGVAVGTVKRFEKTGEIQFNHLLRMALVLGRLTEFDELFGISPKPQSLFMLKEEKSRQRPRRK